MTHYTLADLATAELHIAQGEEHVARQEELVTRLEQEGGDVETAKALLAELNDSLRLHREDRSRIAKALGL